MSRADNVRKILNIIFFHYAGEVLDDLFASKGIDEVCRTDFNSRCARKHHFDHVLGSANAAMPTTGILTA